MGSRKSLASFTGLLLGAGVLALASATPAAAEQPPPLASPPTISGVAQVGQGLTATTATWVSNGFYLEAGTYTWNRCTSSSVSDCSPIPGLSWASHIYVVTVADVGAMIRVYESLSQSGWTVWALSAPTAVVTAAPTAAPPTTIPPPTTPTPPTTTRPTNTGLPKIKGKAKINNKLTVSNGTWTGTAPFAYKYQWKTCNAKVKKCQAIRGATKNSLRISLKYKGHRLEVVVTATNAAGKTTVTCKATGVVVK
jgi:hypothetical protein